MRKTRKTLAVILALSMVMIMVSGCATKSSSPPATPSGSPGASTDKPFGEGANMNLTICGGSIGGAWAAIGEGTGEVIRRAFNGAVVAYEVGQEAANIALVSGGKVDLGMAHTGLLKLATDGSAPFPGKMDNLRAITVLYGEAAQHFIINNTTGVTSFEDIKEKKYPLKLNFNTKDSFMEIVGTSCLEASGIMHQDLEAWGGSVDYMSMGSSIDLMRDGKIGAYSNVIQVPASAVVDASTNLSLNLLSLSDEAIKIVNEKLGTYKVTIPKEAYSFLKEDVNTVAATVVLFANADMSDEVAYNIVKAIDENMTYFSGIHSSLKGLDLAKMQEVAPVALHPGAIKYYEEHK